MNEERTMCFPYANDFIGMRLDRVVVGLGAFLPLAKSVSDSQSSDYIDW
jgi:hypothetical protein